MEKFVLFCNPASGGVVASTAIALYNCIKKIAVAKAKLFPHLKACVRIP
jgi:hypothetical protein